MVEKKIKTGSDFSGAGAFDQALERMGVKQDKKFACDIDRHARTTYVVNYGEPEYFPEDVYDRRIPEDPLDIYMTSPPCQAFSIAGNREGEADERGILFYNSHEFIDKNRPRYFLFENVKGLLSHDKKVEGDDIGRTFGKWLEYLGGKSVNGNPVMFPHEKAVPYHIYWFVLSAKEYNIPQKRERVFILGIRDDQDNNFRLPKPVQLNRTLRDCLEPEVDKKYFLTKEQARKLITKENGYIKVKSATLRGFETAKIWDCINVSFPKSKTKRGRVGKGLANTITTGRNQVVVVPVLTPGRAEKRQQGPRFKKDNDIFYTITTQDRHGILLAEVDEKDREKVVGFAIRWLTPLECFRVQDFDELELKVPETEAYKQAGNSIPVGLLVEILSKLNLN